MRKKALICVSIMLFLSIVTLIIRLSASSYALPDESSKTKAKELEVKLEEEVTSSNQVDYIDLVDIDAIGTSVEVKNSDFEISATLLDDLSNTINSYSAGCSFMVVSLNDGMTFGYNIDESYASGSTIKVSYALYVYKLIEAGKASYDDEVTYEAKFYNSGTGIIKSSAYGTSYTVKDLLYYMLYESDNSAYLMLLNKYGWDGFNQMLDDLGAVDMHLSNVSRWGKISCRSSAIVWQEIYQFSKSSDIGAEFFDLLLNAKYNYFKEVLPDVQSASKSGFTETIVHDTGIIMDQSNPYIIIILNNTGGSMSDAYANVKTLFSKIAPIMQSYNQYLGK